MLLIPGQQGVSHFQLFFCEPVTALVPTHWLPFWLSLMYAGAALQHRRGEKFTLSASIHEKPKLFQSSHRYSYLYLKMSYGFCRANAPSEQAFSTPLQWKAVRFILSSPHKTGNAWQCKLVRNHIYVIVNFHLPTTQESVCLQCELKLLIVLRNRA